MKYYRGDWEVKVDVGRAGRHRGFIMYTLLGQVGKTWISRATEVVWFCPEVADLFSWYSTRGKVAYEYTIDVFAGPKESTSSILPCPQGIPRTS